MCWRFQAPLERLPGRSRGLADPEFGDRLPGNVAELLAGQASAGAADDLVSVRHQAGRCQVEQPRQQLASGQITSSPEQDDDVIVRTER